MVMRNMLMIIELIVVDEMGTCVGVGYIVCNMSMNFKIVGV